MILEIDYTKLSIEELRKLARKDDDKAITEYLRRVEMGEHKPKKYKVEDFIKLVEQRGYL